MDKSWITKSRLSAEYHKGVEDFLEYAIQKTPILNKLRCPCKKCQNRHYHDRNIVRNHLIIEGIQPTYTNWTWHGEDIIADMLTNRDTAGHDMQGLVNDAYWPFCWIILPTGEATRNFLPRNSEEVNEVVIAQHNVEWHDDRMNHEEQDPEELSANPSRKPRGKSFGVRHKSKKDKELKDLHEFKKHAVGLDAQDFITCCTTVGTSPHFLEWDLQSWKHQPKEALDRAWEEVKRECKLSDEYKDMTIRQLRGTWKKEKLRLKHKFWDTTPPSSRRDTPPPGFTEEQWHKMCDKMFSDPKYQEKCIINQVCGSTKKLCHTAGSRSFARMEYDQMRETGRNVEPIPFFSRTHRHKGDTGGNKETEDICDELERRLQEAISNASASSQDSCSASETTIGQRRIMDGLLKSHPGRLTGEGSGFTRSDLEGRKKRRMSKADLNAATEARIQAAMEEFQRRDAIRDEEFKKRDEEFKRRDEEFKKRDEEFKRRDEQLKVALDEVDQLRGQMNFFPPPQVFEGMIANYLKNHGVSSQAGQGNGGNNDQQGSAENDQH